MLLKRRRIGKQLERLDRLPLAEADASRFEALIFAEVTSLWQTDEVRLEKPLVTDEIRMGLDHYPLSLFETLPRLYDEMADSLRVVYETDVGDAKCPTFSISVPGSAVIGTAILSSLPTPRGSRCSGPERDHRPLHRRTGARHRPLSPSSPDWNFGSARARLEEYSATIGDEYARQIAHFELRTLSSPAQPDGRSFASHPRRTASPSVYSSAREFENDLGWYVKAWCQTAGNGWPSW